MEEGRNQWLQDPTEWTGELHELFPVLLSLLDGFLGVGGRGTECLSNTAPLEAIVSTVFHQGAQSSILLPIPIHQGGQITRMQILQSDYLEGASKRKTGKCS